jgi:UDP-sugar transporter A1/2/3
MLCNLRTLYTGVLFYFLMDRRLSGQQWLALWLLVVGAALCQYANIDDTSHLRVSQWGVFLSVVYGFISVAAGVWSELLLKKGTKSIHLDNAQLYSYGVLFNFVGVLMTQSTGPGGEWNRGSALHGWNLWSTWVICFNMAATGIVCSMVLKYYDNVIKIFAITVSNLVSVNLEAILKPSVFDYANTLN